ncbi:rhamnulokinase [Collinsella tanakaei]|uniref:rhamnulokinase n=1 Tax=Collinsella tanakaei TaxID=626935 RepID=UPI00195C7125|nr:rhamnulokinase family protein [Collinsella tanakaei]MBM6756846.1 rhamnulokinase [Collinsella tanakaei]
MAETGQQRYFAAVDIGASSGRVLVGWVEDGAVKLEEVHRFDNIQRRVNGHDCWDIEMLVEGVLAGLAACAERGQVPVSVGIDTWGCDFVLLDEAGQMVGDAVAYRDARTDGIFERADAVLPPADLYAATGIQRQPFNTVYQLMTLSEEHPEQLERAARFLMIPDYLVWRLTGVQVNEYTNASTTGMLDAVSCDWDPKILDALGLAHDLFLKPTMPGAVVGGLTPEVQARVGFDAQVVLPASHDTGSAYLAVPAQDESSIFLSSGTWSLMGVENPEPILTPESRAQNFTNEGGYERRYRYLKNIMGLWMIQSVRRELNGVEYVAGKHAEQGEAATAAQRAERRTYSFGDLIELARQAEPYEAFVDVDDAAFLSPDSMIAAIRQACGASGQEVPQTPGQIMRVIYRSLVGSYAAGVEQLRALTGRTFSAINVIGGGCQDAYLNQLTADACGLPVFAGPVEGTGLGNLAVQMIAAGEFASVGEVRAAIGRSFPIQRYDPR